MFLMDAADLLGISPNASVSDARSAYLAGVAAAKVELGAESSEFRDKAALLEEAYEAFKSREQPTNSNPPPKLTMPSPPSAAPQNWPGTVALVLGIVQFFCFPLIGGVLAIVFGKMGMAKAKQGLATNGGAAKAGFILGIVGLALWVLLILASW